MKETDSIENLRDSSVNRGSSIYMFGYVFRPNFQVYA